MNKKNREIELQRAMIRKEYVEPFVGKVKQEIVLGSKRAKRLLYFKTK